jgi:predicted permease
LFARLKPDFSMEKAAATMGGPYHNIINDVDAPLQKMSEQTLAKFKAKQLLLEPGRRGQSELHNDARVPLTLLLGVTAFVLLIACANIANLLLARAATRSSEIAVRLSIGGSRSQLIRQLLTESCLLAVLGGGLGLLVAKWTLRIIQGLVPAEVTVLKFELDPAAMVFAGALAISTGILFGLFPALHSTRPDLVSVLKAQSGQASGSRSAARFRFSLATAQIALSMALLILAGLFTKSLMNVNRADLGFRADEIVTFGVSPQLNGSNAERTTALYERIEDELRALPGVSSVTSSTVPVLAGDNWGTGVAVQGFQAGPDTDTSSLYTFIGPDYFRTFGIPLIAGREFARSDSNGAEDVAIANEKFTQKFNLGRDAIGKRIAMGRDTKLNIEIVGVAEDSKYSDIKAESRPVLYLPYRQRPMFSGNNFYVRTALNPAQLTVAIRPLMSRIDPNLPVEHLQTMPEQVRAATTVDRVISTLSGAFALVATLLAAIGLYGVLAYTVAQRTREIGVRMALGAAPGRVRKMVLQQVSFMTAIGGVIGIPSALALGKFAESLLFKLNAHDPTVLGVSVVLLVLVALGAGFIPAHRASRVDPIGALRYE